MRTSVWTGLALPAVSLAFCFSVLEIGLRVTGWPGPGFRPTHLRTMASSRPRHPDFRSRSYHLEPRPQVFSILTVGDSFTWGSGVHPEDAFPDRLQSRLATIYGHHEVEVINWSRPGWNTVTEYRSLKGRLEDLAADLLLLGFVLNDPEPSGRTILRALRAEHGVLEREPRSGASTFLRRQSQLYDLVWTRLENLRLRGALRSYYLSLYEGRAWDACRAALRRFRNTAAELGVPMVLVILPVFDSRFDDSYPYTVLHETMKEVGKELQIPTLDLLPTYRDVDPRRLALDPWSDAHPNELAHRMAADAILDYLLQEGLLPPSGGRGESERMGLSQRGGPTGRTGDAGLESSTDS